MWSSLLYIVLLKGKYLFVARLKVAPTKSVSIGFVLMGIGSPFSLNSAIMAVLILSSFWQFALLIASSSSPLYKPATFWSTTVLHRFNKESLTSSNKELFPFSTHVDVLLKRRNFLELLIVLIVESVTVVTDLANEMEQLSSSSDIDG